MRGAYTIIKTICRYSELHDKELISIRGLIVARFKLLQGVTREVAAIFWGPASEAPEATFGHWAVMRVATWALVRRQFPP